MYIWGFLIHWFNALVTSSLRLESKGGWPSTCISTSPMSLRRFPSPSGGPRGVRYLSWSGIVEAGYVVVDLRLFPSTRLENKVGSRSMIIGPTNITRRRVTITSVRAFSLLCSQVFWVRGGVDNIDYKAAFHLFKDKGSTKFLHEVTYNDNYRLVKMEQFHVSKGANYDGFNYKLYGSWPGAVSIHALSVFTSDLTLTELCMSNDHYSGEVNLIMISMQFLGVRGFPLRPWLSISTPKISLSELELGWLWSPW